MLFLFAAAVALQLARQPGQPSWDTVWQEDGAIFYTDARNGSMFTTILEPYNSYLHVVPRLVALVVAELPLEVAAIGLSVGATAVVAALGIYVFYASGAIFGSLWARVLVAVMIVLLPAGGYETNANIANLHWYLVYAAFWVLLANPRTRGGIVLGAVIVAGAVLSDPLAALMFPLVARRALDAWRGDRAGLVIPAVFAGSFLVQLVIGVFQEQTGRNASSSWGDLPGVYALRVAGSMVVGDAELHRFWNPLGYAFAYSGLALVVALLVYGFLKADHKRRWFIGESVLYSVLTLCVPLMLRGTENFLDQSNFSLNGSRYTVLPIMFLAGALIAVFDTPDPRLSPRAWRHVQVGFAAFLAALVLTSFGINAVRSDGPSWKAQLAWAEEECAKRARGENADPLWNLPRAPGQEATPMSQVRTGISPLIVHEGGNVEFPFAVALRCSEFR